MSDTIILQPQEQSPVVVEGNASKTPIKITTDMDYSHVAEMIDKKIGDIDMSAIAKEATLLAESAAIKQAIASAKPEVDLSVVANKLGDVESALEMINNTLGTI